MTTQGINTSWDRKSCFFISALMQKSHCASLILTSNWTCTLWGDNIISSLCNNMHALVQSKLDHNPRHEIMINTWTSSKLLCTYKFILHWSMHRKQWLSILHQCPLNLIMHFLNNIIFKISCIITLVSINQDSLTHMIKIINEFLLPYATLIIMSHITLLHKKWSTRRYHNYDHKSRFNHMKS